jgi:hypothetical protein
MYPLAVVLMALSGLENKAENSTAIVPTNPWTNDTVIK